MDENNEAVVRRAKEAVYWGRYGWLQELWRRGEKLTLERWGRAGEVDSGDEREMRQLGQELEALLVGFGEGGDG